MNDYESGLLRVCQLLVEEQIDLCKRFPGREFSTTFVGESGLEKIDWTDVDLKEDLQGYLIEILPASALASTLSARIEDVYDMKDLGLLTDPEETWDYIDMPDRRRLKRKHLSPRKLMEKVVEKRVIKDGEDVNPEPEWPLALLAKLTQSAITELELYEDAPKDRLQLLRQLKERVRLMIEGANELDTQTNAALSAAATGMTNAPDLLNGLPGAGPLPEGGAPLGAPGPAGLGAPEAVGNPADLAGPDLGGGLSAAEAAAAGGAGGA
jgi:hypothetical protein